MISKDDDDKNWRMSCELERNLAKSHSCGYLTFFPMGAGRGDVFLQETPATG